MKKMNYPVNQAIFKVKKHWWMWALAIIFNILGISSLIRGYYFIFVVVLIADLIVLSDACHYRYVINDKFLEVKGILLSGSEILLASITTVEEAVLMTFGGFGMKIYTDSMGSYRIKYMDGRREKAILVAPKDRERFINELGSRVDKTVMQIGSGFEFIQGKKQKYNNIGDCEREKDNEC
jgi:hypothetical protein